MDTIEWTEDLVLGIPEMDDAHRAFVERLAALAASADSDFGHGFPAIVSELERDFAAEEKVMEDIGFPSLPVHREQHARVLGALHHVMPHVMDGDIEAGRESLRLLHQWFGFHLTTLDAALAWTLEAMRSPQHMQAG